MIRAWVRHWRDPALRADAVLNLVVGGLALALGGTVVRVAQLQVAPGEALSGFIADHVSFRESPAMRGDLLDRCGRVLATSRMGTRVFIDPARFPVPAEEALARLSSVIDTPMETLAERIVPRIAENERRRAAAGEAPAPGELSRGWREQLSDRLKSMMPDKEDPGDEAGGGDERGLLRYVRITDVIDDATAEAVRVLDIPGVHVEHTPVREYPGSDVVAPVVGRLCPDERFSAGAERTLNAELGGQPGRVRYVRDKDGKPLWLDSGSWTAARRGRDIRLSIDAELQRIAAEELARGVEEADAGGGRLVMCDPLTGEILAMIDLIRQVPEAVDIPWEDAQAPRVRDDRIRLERHRPRYRVVLGDELRQEHPELARNRCVQDVYEPGSTFKPFVWSTITTLGKLDPDDPLEGHPGGWSPPNQRRTVKDVTPKDRLTWREVLVYSSNVGMAQGVELLSHDQLHSAVRRFGFGARTGLDLPGESRGIVHDVGDWSRYNQTSVAMGYGVSVTPVQMVRAFSVFARPGDLAGTLPRVSMTAVLADDAPLDLLHRVLPAPIAAMVREPMAEVVARMEAHIADPPEGGWRYRMFGKSGTSIIATPTPPKGKRVPAHLRGYIQGQYNSSFIAAGPVEDPRLVILVVIDDPGPERVRRTTHYGSYVAGPVVRRVMERSLVYLGVTPPAPRPTDETRLAGLQSLIGE